MLPCNSAMWAAREPSWFAYAMRIRRWWMVLAQTRITVSWTSFATISGSTYNAMQATLRVQGWHGLSGFAGYTFSKSLDDASDGIDYNFATVALPQDSNQLECRTRPFQLRHPPSLHCGIHLSGRPYSWTDKARLDGLAAQYDSDRSRAAAPYRLSAHWTTSGSWYQNGSRAKRNQRPNLIPGANPVVSNWESAPDSIGYLNPAAFTQPLYPSGNTPSFGNLGRNAIYGPRFWNVDFAIAKNTQIFEHLNLQLRGEFFNIFNHPNFALPNFFVTPTTYADGTPTGAASYQGLITQTPDVAQTNPGLGGGGPRVIQVALKLIF